MELRPYQKEAIGALWACWKQHPKASPILVCPTGSGKSLLCAEVIRKINKCSPTMKILVLTHRKEIIQQNSNELYGHAGIVSGIYSHALKRKDFRVVTLASIQSIYKKKDLEAGLIIIDECHLVSQKDTSMYQKLIANVRANNKDVRILGTSATPMRMDQGSLVGEGTLFDTIAYDISIKTLIDQGYLCPLVSKVSSNKVDYSEVSKVGYDYNQGELEKLLCPLTPEHCAEIIAKGQDRKHWLIFCSGVLHSKEIAEELCRRGIKADYVTGDMLQMVRDKKLEDFKNGKIRALCNCDILTTGFNFPGVDLLVLLRATRSTSLYIQIVGRGSRTAPGKADCRVLDFGGNVERHGPVDCISISRKVAEGSGKAIVVVFPTKVCASCGLAVPKQVRVCPECRTAFPIEAPLVAQASSAAIISEPEVLEVDHMLIDTKQGPDKPKPHLSVRYYTSRGPVIESLCFDHDGFPYRKATQRWQLLGGKVPAPKSVSEGYHRKAELPKPKAIAIVKDDKWWRIERLIFPTKEEAAREQAGRSWMDEVGL